jgi:branched-chain amino acid transport system permease protein
MDYYCHIVVLCGIYAILAMSLNLVVGYTGLLSLGHGAFACVGAYCSSILSVKFGVSPWLGLVLGPCLAMCLAVVVGTASVRLKRDYLALCMFGLAVIIYSMAKNLSPLTGGPLGLRGIPTFGVGGLAFSTPSSYSILVAA